MNDKKMLSRLVLVVNFFVVAYAWTVNNCPSGLSRDEYLIVFGDKCYGFELHRLRNYQEAQDYCNEDGGTLVVVKDKVIEDFINETIHELYYFDDYKLWIGLQYDKVSGTFVWSDGLNLNYSNFQEGPKPDKPCISIDIKTGKWVGMECDYYTGRFVCEYPVNDDEFKKKEFPTSISKNDCPPNYNDQRLVQTLDDTCYLFFTLYTATFNEAETYCSKYYSNYNPSLAMVKSKQVNDFLQYHLFTTHRLHFESLPVWIGLQYDFNTQDYRWVDGSKPNYTNYMFEERYQECFTMSAMSGEWQESQCGHKEDEKDDGDKLYFICQMDPRTLPTTTTTTPLPTTTATTPLPTTTTTNTPPPTTTTTPPPTTTTTTPPPPTTSKPDVTTCAPIVCDRDCGMDGYQQDPDTGCMLCECSQ